MSRSPAGVRRNVAMCCWRLFSSTTAPQDAPHQRILAQNVAARLDKRHQHLEGTPAELDRPAFDEDLAAIRENRDASELDDRR
jgi:hypothetical protein